MNSLEDLAQQAEAPIDRGSIDAKVEVFERRMNGKILPFAGLHGTLLALVYLIRETELFMDLAVRNTFLPAFVVFCIAAVCGFGVLSYRVLAGDREVPGAAALAIALAMIGALMLPWIPLGAVLAVAFYLLLLALNAFRLAGDYEFNTVSLYLPVILLVVGGLAGAEQLIAGTALYAPAIYVKFRHQPQSNKLALGVSVLVYLAIAIEDNAETQGLIAAMVSAVLLLFIVYSIRTRHLPGSSYRHFLTDAILVGLWGVLVSTFGIDDEAVTLAVAGFGIAIYQGIRLVQLQAQETQTSASLAERDARLAWLQIAAVMIFANMIIDALLEAALELEIVYPALLLVVLPFVPLYWRLQSPFLALATRLWIGGCLLGAVHETLSVFHWDYVSVTFDKTAAELRDDFLAGFGGELFWAVFALLAGMIATLRTETRVELPWWRGVVPPRPMVLVRRSARLVIANANKIAFVGGFIAAIAALFNWLRYAGGERGGLRSRDLLLLGVHVYAVAMSVLFARFLEGCCDVEAYPALEAALLSFPQYGLPYVLAFCFWGIALYLRGVILHDYLARFFAIAFVTMPLLTYGTNNSPEDAAFLAEVILICCFSLFCFGLLRRIRG